MKRLTILAALMALMMGVVAVPAMAQPFFFNPNFNPNFDNNGFFFDNGLVDNGFFDNGTGISQDVEPVSGDVSLNNQVSNTGNYASQCTPTQQTSNTGNFTNAPAIEQVGSGTNRGFRDGFGFFQPGFFGSGLNGIEPEGIDVSFGGSVTADCPSTIEQSSAASG